MREFDLKQHSNALHGEFVSNRHHVHSSTTTTSTRETSNLLPRFFAQEFDLNSRVQYRGGSVSHQHHSSTEIDFRSSTTASNLNTFIDNHLQPTTEFNNEMNETVDKICKFLRDHFQPAKVVKGGSLGKGTAVKGKSDIDLVLILNEVTSAADLKTELPKLKEDIIEKLRRQCHNYKLGIEGDISETPFAVKFTVKGKYENIDVDLLPTFHVNDLKRLYNDMTTDVENIDYYSVALVKYQVEFVRGKPANLKNLIRLIKYWKKENVRATGSGRIPTSYVMELITIHLWEKRKGYDGTFDTLKALHGIMTALNDYTSLQAIWNDNYQTNEIPRSIQGERPLVMDPANPTNNVCSNFEWEEIRSAAINVLGSPMMRGVTSTMWN